MPKKGAYIPRIPVIKNKPKSRWKDQEENQREVNGTRIQVSESPPDPKISIGRVQNKLAVDSPRDETKGPFLPGGDRAPGSGIEINKTDLMLKGHGLHLHTHANTGAPERIPNLQDCLCVVSFVRYTPVLPVGCFLGPSHFNNCILVLLGLCCFMVHGF